jgi:hypothetical protein
MSGGEETLKLHLFQRRGIGDVELLGYGTSLQVSTYSNDISRFGGSGNGIT